MADDIANDIKPAGDYRYNEYIRADLLIDGKVDASALKEAVLSAVQAMGPEQISALVSALGLDGAGYLELES